MNGTIVWFTGLPGAGKTTLATAVEAALRPLRRVQVLDGDVLRQTLSSDLGFSDEDRARHLQSVAFVAGLLAQHDVTSLVSVIAPRAAHRTAARECAARAGVPFLEVFVDAPLATCEARDPKGLYARARAGDLRGLTGVDAPYERPQSPDVHVDTSVLDVAAAAAVVLTAVERTSR